MTLQIKNKIGVDGIGHINVSADATTELGQRLNEFHEESFIHPIHGIFSTLVGLKCYLRTGCTDQRYRYQDPEECVKRFSETTKVWNKDYMHHVALGYIARIKQAPDLAKMLWDSDPIPFAAYQVPKEGIPDYVSKDRDIMAIDMWTTIRERLAFPGGLDSEYHRHLIKLGYLGPRG